MSEVAKRLRDASVSLLELAEKMEDRSEARHVERLAFQIDRVILNALAVEKLTAFDSTWKAAAGECLVDEYRGADYRAVRHNWIVNGCPFSDPLERQKLTDWIVDAARLLYEV